MHGGFKHNSKTTSVTRQVPQQDENGNNITNPDGTPALISKVVDVTTYNDTLINGQADRVRALHPFPIPPFPIMGAGMNTANTLLRKRLEPKEEEWVEARLRKASEFAHVPSEWGIEPRKSDAKTEKDDSDSDEDKDEGDDGAAERLPTKRVKGTLDEDQILDLWKFAHQEAFDAQYLRRKYPEAYGEGEGDGDGDEEGDSPTDDEKDEDEEEFEDVMDTSGAPEASAAPEISKSTDKSEAPGLEPAPVTVPAKPAAHQPVPGLPVLSLSFVHKFMSSGEVSVQ